MTNQQGAPEALRLADSYAKAHAMYCMEDLYGTSKAYTAELLKERHAARERLAAALVEAQQPAPSAAADLIAALEEARSAINSMKVEAETAAQGDEQMMLEACETISNEGLKADMAIRAALASAPQPSPTPQADSQPAPLLAADHQGMRVDYSGLLGECQRALRSREPAQAEMLRQLQGHINELGQRWYAGDTAVVDEILQLYCVERDARQALKGGV